MFEAKCETELMDRKEELFRRSIKYNLEKIMMREQIDHGDKLKCDVCGREVTVNVRGKGDLICCGKPMFKIGDK